MHLIRRSAARAIAAPVSSFKVASSSSPAFLARSKTQSAISTSVFKRAYSDESRPADGEQSSVNNAVNTANESAPSNAYQDRAPREYQPRESRPYDNNRGGDRGGYGGRGGRSGGYGGDRGGGRPYDNRGGDRGGYGGDRGGYRSGPPREFTPREVVPGPSVYVGNILFDVTAADLSREFSDFGTIKDVIIATDARGLSKGFAYIEFENQEQAAAAIEGKHQTVLEGRRLVVNYMSKSTRERPENPPSKTLFIGNLAFEMSDGDLNKLFRDIANVIDVRVAIDRRTGQPRGFAHADFVDTASATAGKEALLGKEVYGRKLRVDFSAGSRESRGDGAAPRDFNAPRGDDGPSA